MSKLVNKLSKEEALARVQAEPFARRTISFYKYVRIQDPHALRDELWRAWDALGVLGRIYISQEGINAQLSVPEHNHDGFRRYIDSFKEFRNVPFKYAVSEQAPSFWKLTLKVREQIVADGLAPDSYDIENVGRHLSAKEWNEAMEEGATVVDMRNNYESDIGHFEGAITPNVETFREELPQVLDELKGKEDDKILLYCTGGVRCEKTSAYLKHHGFKDVNQLHGGIIDYKHQIDREKLDNKYIGKNFVFDGRRAEAISEDVIGTCLHCEGSSDRIIDCVDPTCHVLHVQCENCEDTWKQACSPECREYTAMSEEDQAEYRKGKQPKSLARRKIAA